MCAMLDRLAGNVPLKSAVAEMTRTGRMGHSLLLIGEAGLGAGFAARCIAADLLYPEGGTFAEAMVRGECCRAVAVSGRRDSGSIETGLVREAISVTGGSKDGSYIVGQVMAARAELFNSSLSTRGRVVLLYHVERMNEASANALLKVLEEPPENVTFLLTASSLAAVLPTIRSRCASMELAPLPPAACAAYCEKQGVPREDAVRFSALFDGHIGTVLRLARDANRRARLDTACAIAEAAAKRDAYTVGALLANLEKDKAEAVEVLENIAILAAAGLNGTAACPLSPDASARVIRIADAARADLGANVNIKAALTLAAIRFSRAQKAS